MSKRFHSDDAPQDFGFLNSESSADIPPSLVPQRDSETPLVNSAAAEEPPATLEPPPVSLTSEDSAGTQKTPRSSKPNRPRVAAGQPASDVEPTSLSKVKQGPAGLQGTRWAKSTLFLAGYALVVTLFLMYLLITGRSSRLESLPDIRPLKSNEFQLVPEGASVPEGHALRLGQSARFGDLVVTPVRVTREPLTFVDFMTKQSDETLTQTDVVKLWLTMKNVSANYAFPPFDSGLMSHRSPRDSKDESALANTFLTVRPSPSSDSVRVLNFLHSMDSNFLLVGQRSNEVIAPGETLETFVATSEKMNRLALEDNAECVWRVLIRKGVHQQSGNGVTTLVDVAFRMSDIQPL